MNPPVAAPAPREVSPPFPRVLVPLDGSRLARAVLPVVRRLLGAGSFELTLLRVVEAAEGPDADDAPVKADLEAARTELGPGSTSTVALRRGDAAEEILRAAPAFDLVAMATHGRTGLDRWVRGSVAERVLRGCPVPLLLCNPHTLVGQTLGRVERIVAPLDGSERAERVLPAVQRLALAHDAQVTLLTVELPALTEVSLEGLVPEARREARERQVRAAADALQRAGVRARAESAFGPVASEILRAGRDADLLALSTHGRSGPARWWFGSVAEEVLRRAPCPLLLVVRGTQVAPAPTT